MTPDDALLGSLAARARERQREARAPGDAELGASITAALLAQRSRERAALRWRRSAIFGTGLAAAAGVLLWIQSTRGPAATAPEYLVAVAGLPQETRSVTSAPEDAPAVLEAAPSAQEVVLRPRAPWSQALEVRVWAVRPTSLERIESNAEVSDRGAVRLRLPAGSLIGATEARVLIAPPAILEAAAAAATSNGAALPGAALVRIPVQAAGARR
jgi:hypothetical protein